MSSLLSQQIMFLHSSVLFILFLVLLLFAVAFPVYSISFDQTTSGAKMGNCSSGENTICMKGDASYGGPSIHLNPDPQSVCFQCASTGWAYYSEPLHLWDNSTGELASFNTSFLIDIRPMFAPAVSAMADGAAFFLAPHPYQIQDHSDRGRLGLVSLGNEGNTSHLAAVEFDTYQNNDGNLSDIATPHIGIDINSLVSVKAAVLSGGINGRATIRYEASTQNLSVLYFSLDGSQVIRLSYIVDLRKILPELVVVGFSGSSNFEYNIINSWVFNSTTIQGAGNSQNTTMNGTGDSQNTTMNTTVIGTGVSHARKQSKVGLLVGVILGSGFILVACTVLFVMGKNGSLLTIIRKGGGLPTKLKKIRSEQKRTDEESSADHITHDAHVCSSIDSEFENDTGPRRFQFQELVSATSNFSEDRKLGAGGFGCVYRGFLPDLNIDVAIKRFLRDSKPGVGDHVSTQGAKEYIAEVSIITRLRHKNLVRLIGWCHEHTDLLLVYEFMPNGSLDNHLFGMKTTPLSWAQRYKIALGLASALSYLHTEWEQCVIHRDIKSSNIMLDSNFNAKLGDFGLARLVDHESKMQTTIVAGTYGYIAPECFISGKYSKESDVYSLGIVLLEIACGRPVNDSKIREGNGRLVDWVWRMYKDGRTLEVVDPLLQGNFDRDQMERLIVIALWCANLDLISRPSMDQVVAAIKFDIVPVGSFLRESTMTSIIENRTPQLPFFPTSNSRSSTVPTSTLSISYGSSVSSNMPY